jgi:hypothetical protein
MNANNTATRTALALTALVALGGCDLPDDAASSDESASAALTTGPTRCPALNIRRTGVDAAGRPIVVSNTPVPGPMSARIIANAQQISCGPTNQGEVLVGTTVWTDAIAPFPVTATPRGNVLVLNPSLPFQATPEGDMAIASFTCRVGDLRLEGSGWPNRVLSPRVEFQWSQSGGKFHALCRVYAKPPITVVQNRPADLVTTSGDRFIYRCDLQGTARRNACNSLCGTQCTANLGFPPDSAGINRCIADCTDRCAADTGCPPVFCSGSDCPGTSCAPANVCTTSSQCGSGRTCAAGCCVTIIH